MNIGKIDDRQLAQGNGMFRVRYVRNKIYKLMLVLLSNATSGIWCQMKFCMKKFTHGAPKTRSSPKATADSVTANCAARDRLKSTK